MTTVRTNIDSMQLMLTFNASEKWLMSWMLDNVDPSSLQVKIQRGSLTNTKKKYLSAAYKSLRSIDLVRRVKPGTYMLSPEILVSQRNRKQLKDYYWALDPLIDPIDQNKPVAVTQLSRSVHGNGSRDQYTYSAL